MSKFRSGQPITAAILNSIKQAMRSMITSGPGVTINSSGDKIVIGVQQRQILRGGGASIKVATTQANLGTPAKSQFGTVTAYVTGSAVVTKDVLMYWDDTAANKETPTTDDWRVHSTLTAASVANLGAPTNPPCQGVVDTGSDDRIMWMPADGTTNGSWRDFNLYGTAAL